jgi:ribonucleoside-diphosphate reductase alpha chain
MDKGIDLTRELSPNAMKVLEKRYLKKDDLGNCLERPEDLFRRVANNIAQADANYGAKDSGISKTEEEFFEMMARLEFLPNSPTLMNAGRDLQQLSACFVLPIEDSMESIFETIKDTALIHKSGGGTGFSFSRLRAKNSPVRSTGGISSGPVSFMKVFNAATQAVKQGGTRRGANMGILRVDHPDILEFISCKESDKEITNFNISVAITEDFMKKAVAGEDYDLIDPKTKRSVQKLNAKKVFETIIQMAWKNGEPGIIFIDRINRDNPTPKVGQIESTNPCVTGGTFVSTEFGLMKIRDIAERFPTGGMAILTDDRVLEMAYGGEIISGSLKTEVKTGTSLSTIAAAWKTGFKETVKLITRSGYELVATPDHRIMTIGGWRQVKDLKPGVDRILLQYGEGRFNPNGRLPFDVKNEYTGENGRTYKLNLPQKWTKQLGQLLGYMIGDGWLRDGDKDCRVGLTFSAEDKEVLTYIKYIANNFYGSTIKEVERENGVYHLSYHSRYFVDFFRKLGVRSWQADEKEVPELIFTATEEAVIGFIQGLFTADGTVRDNPKSNSSWIALTSKSKILLQQVQLLLLNLGIRSSIFDRSRKPREELFSYNSKSGEIRSYSSDGVLFELGVFGEGREKFKSLIGFLDAKKNTKSNGVRFSRFYNMAYEDEVRSVENVGIEMVYDLTEPFTHSMITNGIVAHQCGEQPLLPYESCNLGSVNLSKMVTEDRAIDWDKLSDSIEKAVHFLDNVIDMNSYPIKKIEDMTKSNRKIGLGVMGFADMLLMLGIRYDSEEAIELAEKIMKFVLDESRMASERLAAKRGAFANFNASALNTAGAKPLRNATLTTIAPTGTLSIIANSSSGIEPVFAITYIRNIMDNTKLIEVHPYFQKVAEERGFYTPELMSLIAQKGTIRGISEIPEDVQSLFVTAHDIEPIWHIRMQAAFQKYTNNAVSKTVNLPSDATMEDAKTIYMLAYKSGCKGVTIYRDKSREEQVLNKPSAPEAEQKGSKASSHATAKAKISPRPRPQVITGTTIKIATGCGNLYITINEDDQGQPFEVFMHMGKAGGCAMSQLEAIGRLLSLALRSGIELHSIVEQLRGIRCPSPSWEKGGRIFSCSDAIARAIEHRAQEMKHRKAHAAPKTETKDNAPQTETLTQTDSSSGTTKTGTAKKAGNIVGVCPDCGGALWHIEGCMVCKSCGYSKCG